MSTQTTNLGLTKPDGSEVVDISVINSNYDIIDTKLRPIAHDAEWVLQQEYSSSANTTYHEAVTIPAHSICIVTGNFWYNAGTLSGPTTFYAAMVIDNVSNTNPYTYSATVNPVNEVACDWGTVGSGSVIGTNHNMPNTNLMRIIRNDTSSDVTWYVHTYTSASSDVERKLVVRRDIIGYA